MNTLNEYLAKPYAPETRAFKKSGGIILSPSAISKYFENAGDWWNDRVGTPTFDGNTSTVLGNAIHGSIDAYYDDSEVTSEDVYEWVSVSYTEQMDCIVGHTKATKAKASVPIAKVDRDIIVEEHPGMFQAWKASYADMYPAPDKREEHVRIDLDPDIILAGTFDGYESDRKVLIDYKTTGKMISSMSKAHEFQLVAYAMAMIAKGNSVDFIRVVYIIRPTKTIAARVVIFEKELTDKMLMTQVRVMENMRKSIKAVREHPELEDVIFRENLLSTWN